MVCASLGREPSRFKVQVFKWFSDHRFGRFTPKFKNMTDRKLPRSHSQQLFHINQDTSLVADVMTVILTPRASSPTPTSIRSNAAKIGHFHRFDFKISLFLAPLL